MARSGVVLVTPPGFSAAAAPRGAGATVGRVDPVARALAVAGFLLAVGSLGWQVRTHTNPVRRVRVELGTRRPAGKGWSEERYEHKRTVVTGRDHHRQGWLLVTVRNTGGVPVDVTAVRVAIDGTGDQLSNPAGRAPDQHSPTLPHRLEPGSAATWRESLPALLDLGLGGRVVRGVVVLGTGAERRSRTGLRLPPNR